MNGDLLNAISNTSNSDQQEYEEITNKIVEIGESYPITADEITAAIKKRRDEMNRKELAEKYGVDKEEITCSKCRYGLTIVAGPPKFIYCDKRHAWGSDVWCESYEYKWGKEK